MKKVNSYIIKPNTIVIIPQLDEKGMLYSYVLEGNTPILVKMTPKMIIEQSLLYYGTSLQGAMMGARSIIGDIKMAPIMICSELEIYWFPSTSPDKEDCIWFSQGQVVDSKPVSKTQVMVYFSFGHTITIDMKKARFNEKYERATKLRYIRTERTKSPSKFSDEPFSGIQIWKDPRSNHFDFDGVEG